VHSATITKTIIYLLSDSVFKFCQGDKTCHVPGVTSFVLNKCSDLFGMMNLTVVKNEDTLWPWVWIFERYLVSGQI
jgi:hypothetical protein